MRKTYQDFQKAKDSGKVIDFIRNTISDYRTSREYLDALDADEYEAERNITIMRFVRWLFNDNGQKIVDFTASNHRIASNFFHKLTTQRVAYSLGNGISFASAERVKEGNTWKTVDAVKEKLGSDFDTVMYKASKCSRRHGVSYLFWNVDHLTFFKATEFCPLYDEIDGSLKAGFRFWSLDWENKPVTIVVYDMDGYEKYRTKTGSKGLDIELYENKRSYKEKIAHNNVDPDIIIEESNYSYLPIVPFWGSDRKQSDLIGMRSKIDTYDLIKSGFANDLDDCAQIYWIIENAMGMDDGSLAKFRDKLKLNHIAAADTINSKVTPYTQEIPFQARQTLLDSIRNQIYEDYGGLDVHAIAAGATNDHIDAAYQPMDDEADDFEYQVIIAIQGILKLMNIDDVPVFKRNKISNMKETTDMVLSAANYLDDETVLRKLPFITSDEVESILAKKDSQDQSEFELDEQEPMEV